MRRSLFPISTLLLTVLISAGTASTIVRAGARASSYGFDSLSLFPTPTEWSTINSGMAEQFSGSTPTALWIVAGIGTEGDMNGKCVLEFSIPADERTSTALAFDTTLESLHESALTHFDTTGVKAFLQVEPGLASVDTLIDIVLRKFGHHPCVAGFGIDVEWYCNPGVVDGNLGANVDSVVTDAAAERWNTRIKSYNPDYRLFVKHWMPELLCPNYRSDVIFIDDAQDFSYLSEPMGGMADEFTVWAEHFAPAEAGFQIGYDPDKTWWSAYSNPPQRMGESIADAISAEQDIGIYWVDFTLRDPLIRSTLWPSKSAIVETAAARMEPLRITKQAILIPSTLAEGSTVAIHDAAGRTILSLSAAEAKGASIATHRLGTGVRIISWAGVGNRHHSTTITILP